MNFTKSDKSDKQGLNKARQNCLDKTLDQFVLNLQSYGLNFQDPLLENQLTKLFDLYLNFACHNALM